MKAAGGNRGRPPKFGRPSQVVALTRPEEVMAGLRKINAGLAWAVVRMFEGETRRAASVPVSATRAFLSLESGLGMSDLELAVSDRLDEETIDEREHRALTRLRAQLRRWRRDRALRFHTRARIIEVEQLSRTSRSTKDSG